MLKIKPGVAIFGVRPETVLGINIASQIFEAMRLDCVLTSVTDSKHGWGSLHFTGTAFDLRSRHVHVDERDGVSKALKTALGTDFDVILEKDHFHVEFQPKKGTNL